MIDLTIPISPGMPTFPGDPPITITPVERVSKGDAADVSRYCMGSHCGTHVDPPCHFIPGAATVDELPLSKLVGTAQVVVIDDVRSVTADVLAAAGIGKGIERVLLKTSNSRLWADPRHAFVRDYVPLAPDGARWLVEHGVDLVGIDYLSIEEFHAPGHPVHHQLLSKGVIVVEGLDLRFAAAGEHHLVCLPLKVKGGDGGPARAILT